MPRRRASPELRSALDPFKSARFGPGRSSRFALAAEHSRVTVSLSSERPREIAIRYGRVREVSRVGRFPHPSRTWRLGGLEVRVGGDPPALSILDRGAPVFETATELPVGKLPAPDSWGTRGRGISWPLRFAPEEHIYGAGEFFGPLDHVGRELRTSIRDVFGLPNEATYVTYPFFWSTRGYGFLAETWAPETAVPFL